MEDQHGTYRRQFLAKSLKTIALLFVGSVSTIRRGLAEGGTMKQPETAVFKDDGAIPNNRLHVLLYRGDLPTSGDDPSAKVIQHFAANNWTNSWRNGMYPCHHYNSSSHKVLCTYRRSAT